MADEINIRPILALGIDDKIKEAVLKHCAGAEIVAIANVLEFEAAFDTWSDANFSMIICGPGIAEIPTVELAQTLNNQCPCSLKYFITRDLKSFEPAKLIKNGFSKVFVLPQDLDILRREIMERVLTEKQNLRAVKIADLGADEKLEFETFLYLPLNNRYVRFSSANDKISPERMQRLNEQQAPIFIDQKDMDKFYRYSASRLTASAGNAGGMGETERQLRLEEQVRNLFTMIFDQSLEANFDSGRQVVESCQNIISLFITKGASTQWYAKLISTLGEKSDPYNHASRVSTFAALFAIGLNHKTPEDLAMAGLFHDLGALSGHNDKPEAEWTEEERKAHHYHPEGSLNYLKQKRVSVPRIVELAILHHHERVSGKGFPKGLTGERIPIEAQILSYSDQFDYLTSIEPGKKRVGPMDAHEEIKKTLTIESGLAAKICRLLQGPPPVKATA